MSTDELIRVSREDAFHPNVDKALEHQKALARQARPVEPMPTSPVRQILLSNLLITPVAGLLGGLASWALIEPSMNEKANPTGDNPVRYIALPVMATLIVLFIYISDGLASRKLRGNLRRWAWGVGLAPVLTGLALIPLGLLISAVVFLFADQIKSVAGLTSLNEWPASVFIGIVIVRSMTWAGVGAAAGLGMNMVRSTPAQVRASVMGGAVGGALGGLLFDPINRFLFPETVEGTLFRLVGFCTIGLCVGLFVALGERLGREGWLRVRTGPLAGKAFILYRNPTVIGSSPHADIYLFKDSGIASTHAAIHRVGTIYEVEALDDEHETLVNGRPVRRHRLVSADQITVSNTLLDFEERSGRKVAQGVPVKEA